MTETATRHNTPGRSVRAVASESWDDDFLWQHSSSSDLHLPLKSGANRARPVSSSGIQSRSRTSKTSTFSIASTADSIDRRWTSTNFDEQDEPTITLRSGIPLKKASTSPAQVANTNISRRHTVQPASLTPKLPHSPSFLSSRSASDTLSGRHSNAVSDSTSSQARDIVPPASPSPSPSSMASWRSQTPSLTSDLGAQSSSTATETGNETEGWDDMSADTLNTTPRLGFSALPNLSKGKGRAMMASLGTRPRNKRHQSTSSSSASADEHGATPQFNRPWSPVIHAPSPGYLAGARLPFNRHSSSSTQSSTSSATSSAFYSHSPISANLAVHPQATIIPLHQHIVQGRTARSRQSTSTTINSGSSGPSQSMSTHRPPHSSNDSASSADLSQPTYHQTFPDGFFIGPSCSQDSVLRPWSDDDVDTDRETASEGHAQAYRTYNRQDKYQDDEEELASITMRQALAGFQEADVSTTSLATSVASNHTTKSTWSADSQPRRRNRFSDAFSKKSNKLQKKKPKHSTSISSIAISPPIPQTLPETGLSDSFNTYRPLTSPALSLQTNRTDSSDTSQRRRTTYLRRRNTTTVSNSRIVPDSDTDQEPSHQTARMDRSAMAFADDSEVDSLHKPAHRSSMSNNAKVSSIPFPSPERKGGSSATRFAEQNDTEPTAKKTKAKRPNSLTAFLTRSITSTEERKRNISVIPALSESVVSEPDTTASDTVRRARPGHRATMSNGAIPSAKQLLCESDHFQSDRIFQLKQAPFAASISPTLRRTPSLEPGRMPQSSQLTARRSVLPLRQPFATSIAEERPPSSMSLWSETSTVRPLSQAKLVKPRYDTKGKAPLPSSNLSIAPDLVSTSASNSPRLPAPSSSSSSLFLLQKALTPTRSMKEYFDDNTFSSTQGGSSPGSRSNTSANSRRGTIIRRVSLSDLRIPPMISMAQAKIGQDLKRVKEFKQGVEELKNLRRVYRSIVSTENTPEVSFDTSLHPTSLNDISNAEVMSDCEEGDRPFSDLVTISPETSSKLDQIFARVAFDYRKWWEIADVLINLADGETSDSDAEGESEEAEPRTRTLSERPQASVNELGGGHDHSAESRKDQIGKEMASDEGVDVSTPLPAPSTGSVAMSSPSLNRSVSFAHFSPTLGTQKEERYREIVNLEGTALSLNERQMDILRGMLKPSEQTTARKGKEGEPGSTISSLPGQAQMSALQEEHDTRTKASLTAEKRLPSTWSVQSHAVTKPTPASTLITSQAESAASTPTQTIEDKTVEAEKPKGRLRQASRAGMLGIRDFLKALKRTNTTPSPTPTASDFPSSPPAAPSVGNAQLQPVRLSPDRRVVSDSRVPGSVSSSGHITPVRQSLLAATLAIHNEAQQANAASLEVRPNPKSGSPASNGTGSSSEEDWDTEVENENSRLPRLSIHLGQEHNDASPLRHRGVNALQGFQRSDTQSTLLARTSAGHALSKANQPSSPGSPTRSPKLLNASLNRHRTYSANSTSTLTSPSGFTNNWPAGNKLVMTSDAMPTLLKKIEEVKLHCSICVTELRNITV